MNPQGKKPQAWCQGSLQVVLGDESGWSFIETIIVIAIVLVLSAAVGFTSAKFMDRARVATARSEIATLAMAIQTYALDCGVIPDAASGIAALWQRPESAPEAWNGPYLSKEVVNDPWGHPYEYVVPGEEGLPFGLRSLGSDGLAGGDGPGADLVSWE